MCEILGGHRRVNVSAVRPRISTLGHAAWDHCSDSAEVSQKPTKIPAQRHHKVPAGMAEAGQFLAQRVPILGVDCAGLQRIQGASSSIVAVAMVDPRWMTG